MFISIESDRILMLNKQQILAERKRKLEIEIETAARINKLGLHPLDVLDDMLHTMMELRKAVLKKEHPQATDEEILILMRQEEDASRRFKSRPVM